MSCINIHETTTEHGQDSQNIRLPLDYTLTWLRRAIALGVNRVKMRKNAQRERHAGCTYNIKHEDIY